MTEHRGRGKRWRFAWSVGVMSFVVLSLVALVIGWALTMVDSQYEASPIVERVVIGIFGGAFVALLASPITALVSVVVAGGAWLYRGRSTSGAGSPSTSG